MSQSERIKLQGRKAEIQQEIEELKTRGDNHIITIRDLIDPYEVFTSLEVARAEQAMISLKVLVLQAKEKEETLQKIKRDLGE